MKRKILSLFFVLLAVSFSLAMPACAKDEGNNETTVVLCDFEQYSPDFELLRFMNRFGAIEVNEDAEFVKSGSASAKVMPLGSYYNKGRPQFYIPFYSLNYNYNYKNLRMLESIEASVYNAQDKEETIYLGLVFSVDGSEAIQTSEEKLQPGWNKVTIEPTISTLNLAYDVTDCFGVYFAFDNVGFENSEWLKDSPVYYFDDVVLNLAAEELPLDEDIIVLEEDEYCDFERIYQESVFMYDPLRSTSRVVGAKDGVTPSSGNKMLEVAMVPGSSWTQFKFVRKIQAEIDMTKYRENYTEWAFMFDVYNAGDTPFSISLELYWGEGNAWGTDRGSWGFTIQPGVWTTCKVELINVNNADTTKKEGEMFGRALTEGITPYIIWEDIDEERTLYFDNLKYTRNI